MIDAANTVTSHRPDHGARPADAALAPRPPAMIAPEDLAIVTDIALMRLPVRAAETRRLERMRMLTDASADLGRALTSQTHAMLVNFRGSHGAGNLHDETVVLAGALGRYADLVHWIADEYRTLATQPRQPDVYQAAELSLVPTGATVPGRPRPVSA